MKDAGTTAAIVAASLYAGTAQHVSACPRSHRHHQGGRKMTDESSAHTLIAEPSPRIATEGTKTICAVAEHVMRAAARMTAQLEPVAPDSRRARYRCTMDAVVDADCRRMCRPRRPRTIELNDGTAPAPARQTEPAKRQTAMRSRRQSEQKYEREEHHDGAYRQAFENCGRTYSKFLVHRESPVRVCAESTPSATFDWP